MRTCTTLTLAILVVGILAAVAAADAPGIQATPIVIAASTGTARAADPVALGERVTALEKENIVLREDLGKARLDLRTGLSDLSKQHEADMGRFQKKVDDLNAQLEEERQLAQRRDRNLWIAVGVLAVALIATSN